MMFKTLAMSRVTFTLFFAIGLVVDTAVRADETSSAPVPARSEKSSLPKANDPAVITTAVILGEGEQSPILSWESVLLEELGKIPHVRIVDRSALRQILDEMKLKASGLADPAQAIKLGKLAAADAMIILEKDPASKPPQAVVRVIDTRTGVILLRWMTPASEFEKRGKELVDELLFALGKSRILDDKRRYVGITNIHSEEAGHVLDATARSLTAIIEHDIQRLPHAIMLERKQLQRLTAESNLTGIELNLRTSAVLIEGGIRRERDPNKMTMTLRLIPLVGGKPKEMQVSMPTKDFISERKAIIESIAKGLETSDKSMLSSNARDEAIALMHRGQSLLSYELYDEAVPLLEAAWALYPEKDTYFAVSSGYMGLQNPKSSLFKQIQARLRRLEIFEQYLNLSLAISPGLEGFPLHYFFFNQNFPTRGVLAPEEEGEARRMLETAREMQNRIYRQLNDVVENIPPKRLDLHLGILEHLHSITATPQEYCNSMKTLVDAIGKDFVEVKTERATGNGYYQTLCRNLHDSIKHLTAPPIRENSFQNQQKEVTLIPRWEPESIRPLLEWLIDQKDPTLRMLGYDGILRLPDTKNKSEIARKVLDTMFHDFSEQTSTAVDEHQLFVFHDVSGEAATRLQEAGELGSYCDEMLDRAEKTRDVSELVLWTTPMQTVLMLEPKKMEERCSRIFKIFDQADTSKMSPLAKNKMSYLRQRITISLNYNHGTAQFAPPPEGPWSEYKIKPIPITSLPPGCLKFLRVSIDRNAEGKNKEEPIIMTGFGMARKTASGGNEWDVDVMRLGLEGGKPRHVARYSAENAGVRCIATSPKAIFLGTWNGIVMIEDGHVEQFTEQRGSPGVMVSAMDWLEGSLYVGYEGMLTRFDPATKQFTTLASSKSVKIDSELDGQEMYSVESILADSKNHCLWFSVGKSRNRVGIWKYSPETGKFAKIHEGVCSNLSWSDGQIFFDARSLYPDLKSFCCLDPATLKISHLPQTSFHSAVGGQVEPNWVYWDQRIMSGSHMLQGPDGKMCVLKADIPRWQSLERYDSGCLAATLNDPKLWYIERRSSSKTIKKE